MNLSQAKQLRRDLCRLAGHVVDIKPENSSTSLTLDIIARCTRCKQRLSTAKVKYSDLKIRKYPILDRAIQRIKLDIQRKEDEKFLPPNT